MNTTVDEPGHRGKKSLLLVAANWAATGAGFLATLLVARGLGPEALGALGYGVGLVGVATAAVLPGFAKAHAKRVAEGLELARCLGAMGAIQLALQVPLVAGVLAALALWPGLLPPGLPVAVLVLMLAHRVALNLAITFDEAMLGRQWAADYAAVLVASRGIRLAATVAVLAWTPEVAWVAATYALEGLVELTLGGYLVCVARRAGLRPPDRVTLASYWAYARPLLVTSPIGLLQDSLDRVLVARWAGLAAGGTYQVARGFWELLGTLNAQPFNLLFASLSRLFARRSAAVDQEARRLFASAVDKMLFLVVPAGFLLWALRAPLIRLLYGEGFAAAEGPLMVFVLAALAQAAVNPYHFVVYALDQHGRFVPVVLLRLAVYLAAMPVAVLLAGGTGAALVRLLLVLFPAWVYVRWTRELAGIGFERVSWVYAGGFLLLAGAGEAAAAGLAGLGLPAPAVRAGALLAGGAAYALWLAAAHPGPGANLRYAWDLARPGRAAGRGS